MELNASQAPDGTTPAAVRLMLASPKAKAGTVVVPPMGASLTVPPRLTSASATAAESGWFGPQMPAASQVRMPRVGFWAPPSKSYVMSRSPGVRLSTFAPTVVRSGWAARLISKSKLTVPDRLTRVHASCRYRLPPMNWNAEANRPRLALLFGIEPVPTVTLMSFSFEPSPNELSPCPVARSAWTVLLVTLVQSVLPAVLTTRLPSPPSNVLPGMLAKTDETVRVASSTKVSSATSGFFMECKFVLLERVTESVAWLGVAGFVVPS